MIWYRSITWWIGIVMIALTLIIMTESAGWSMGGKLFPWIIGSGVLITAGLHSILGIFQGVKLAEDEDEEAESEKLDLRRVLSVFIWVLAVLVAVPLVGLQIAVPVFVFLFMKLHGETLTLAAISALVIYGFIVFVLEDIIHVVFPQALIIQWIGF
ncbi:MAG: hypothetical protein HOF23_11740 [Rhodospirillaceae bacterium]|nr:hypothetical protein [Rhodospirillaceae bacterium]